MGRDPIGPTGGFTDYIKEFIDQRIIQHLFDDALTPAEAFPLPLRGKKLLPAELL